MRPPAQQRDAARIGRPFGPGRGPAGAPGPQIPRVADPRIVRTATNLIEVFLAAMVIVFTVPYLAGHVAPSSQPGDKAPIGRLLRTRATFTMICANGLPDKTVTTREAYTAPGGWRRPAPC
jgi:hypothetical protein